MDLTIITSLYHSDSYIGSYVEPLKKVLNSLERESLRVEVILVCNDATRREKLEVERLVHTFMDSLKVSIFPFFVSRESLYRSWNRGIAASSGQCIGFWNVDDIRYPEALVEGVRLIQSGAELVYFPFWNIRKRRRFLFVNLILSKMFHAPKLLSPGYGHPIALRPYFLFNKTQRELIQPPDFDRREFMRSSHIGPFFLFSRFLYEKVGPFDEQFHIVGDFEWQVRATKVADFVLSNEVAGEFLTDQLGLSGRGDELHRIENDIVYLRHGVLDKVKGSSGIISKKGYSIDKIKTASL